MNRNCLLLTCPFRPNIGGVETHLDDLIAVGTDKGVNFTVITYQPLVTNSRGKFKEIGHGFTIYRIPWIRLNLFLILEKFPALEFIYLFPGILLGGFFYLLLNSNKVDVIHSQGLVAGTAGVFLAKAFGKRIIISTHSVYNFPKNGFYFSFIRFIFFNSDRILTLSNQSRKEIISLGIPAKRVSTFTYWVNQKRFAPMNRTTCRRKLRLPSNKFICFFVGRLVEVKGIKELIEAARVTKKEILFLVIGGGPLEDYVRKASKKLKNITFLGAVANKNLPRYYCASDVLIVPSIHEEGFGRVIIEALSSGLPVVGSKRGAIPEAMNEDVGVFLSVSPLEIKRVLEKLHKNPERLLRMRKSARNFALARYSDKNIDSIIKYYGQS